MKTFLKKVAAYLLVVAAITLCINKIYVYKKVDLEVEETKFKNIPDQITICNVGSSHGVHSLYYKDWEETYSCFNMALDAESLSYDKRVLETYKDHLAPGGVVIIDVSYFALFGKSETEDENFESMNKRYYHILPRKQIKEYDFFTDLMVDKLPVLNDDLLDVLACLLKPRTDVTLIKSYPEIDRVLDLETLSEDVTLSCERHIFTDKRDENGNLYENAEEIDALCEMIKMCKNMGVTPILVTTPYTIDYAKKIRSSDPTFFDTFSDLINSLSQELDVAYFDYSEDERFSSDYTLFYNGDHLNSKGARKFTNILFEEAILR